MWLMGKNIILSSLALSLLFSPTSVAAGENNLISYNKNLLLAQTRREKGLSEKEIQEMTRELQALVHRVEATLITVEAKNSEYSGSNSMREIAEEIVQSRKGNASSVNKVSTRFNNSRAMAAIQNAREVLKQFPLVARQDANRARQIWVEARRRLWDSYPVDRPFPQSEIRAMWVDRGTIVKARSKKDLEPLFNKMAGAGINTVFFETVNASYPIYPSKVAPAQNPLTRGWDPLKAAIELAHERGMELHAWVWVFAAANEGHNRIERKPDNYLGPVISRNPDWVLKDQNGFVFNRTPGFKKAFFDPANPQVRNYLLSLFEEIVTKYNVDGIHLDYIRYPFQDSHTRQHFGYTSASRELFKQTYGIDPIEIQPGSEQWRLWTTFRTQQVTSFVSEVSQRLKRKRPDLLISAAVFPIEREKRLNVIQQDWEEWMFNEWVDLIVLMTYALDTGNFETRTRPIRDLADKKNGSLIIPGIRLLGVPDRETIDQVQSIRNMPSGGYALFAAENFKSSLQGILAQTQGSTSSNPQPLPHRQPFHSAFQRYLSLKQEWIFVLATNRIAIDTPYIIPWAEQADKLTARLRELVNNPSGNNLKHAQSELSTLKFKLSRYLEREKRQNPALVDSWFNRLITIDNLLRYGERTMLNGNGKNNSITQK
ncbi:MAG TPA: family 10 glycosylhydrolase [Geminocystis sp. M7585_C2015_104]|nr:family 10 glycosylhydrolase [Geminocystis sp. M7585_C2015_104]